MPRSVPDAAKVKAVSPLLPIVVIVADVVKVSDVAPEQFAVPFRLAVAANENDDEPLRAPAAAAVPWRSGLYVHTTQRA